MHARMFLYIQVHHFAKKRKYEKNRHEFNQIEAEKNWQKSFEIKILLITSNWGR